MLKTHDVVDYRPAVKGGAQLPQPRLGTLAFTAELAEYLMGLFSQTVERGLGFVRESSKTEMIPTVDAQLINSLCSTFVSLLADAKLDLAAENYLEPAKEAVANLYAFGLA